MHKFGVSNQRFPHLIWDIRAISGVTRQIPYEPFPLVPFLHTHTDVISLKTTLAGKSDGCSIRSMGADLAIRRLCLS